jgi:hypothetical protein
MKKHFVYFYGSTKIISGPNSLTADNIRLRNQIIGFEGIDMNPELVEFGEKCLNAVNPRGGIGETGTLYPDNKTIVPFSYLNKEEFIIRHLEDVLVANEVYIKAESIGFPLMELKTATYEAYNQLGKEYSANMSLEKSFKDKWCCFGHYYQDLLRKALHNRGYIFREDLPVEEIGYLNYTKADGTKLMIYAYTGL